MFALGLAGLCHISKNTRGFIVRMFFQWLLTFCVNSWRSLFISSCMSVRFIPLGYFRSERSTTYLCRYCFMCYYYLFAAVRCVHISFSNTGLLLVCFIPDVMSPRAESVYPRYTTLYKATYWKGKLCPESDGSMSHKVYSHFSSYCSDILHSPLRTMQRRWLWSSWTKSIIQ